MKASHRMQWIGSRRAGGPFRPRHLGLALSISVLAACSGREEARVRKSAERLLPTIEAITGIQARHPVDVEVRDRNELREYLIERLREELPPEELTAVRDVYALLGLVPDTMDLGRLLLDLYTEQVAGYYDPKRETLYMIRGAPRGTAEAVLAHELVHALQDQVIDLDSMLEGSGRNDAETAAQAAVEGHAMIAMSLFQLQQAGMDADVETLPSIGDQLAAAQEGAEFPVFRRAPEIVRASMLFPYVEGADFAQAVWVDARRRTGAPPTLQALIPASTEQVLHPRKSFLDARDQPTAIALTLPPGWKARDENSLGEMELGVWLDTHRGDGARSAAIGWDGDRYILADSAGTVSLLWWSVWDDAAAADRFAAAAGEVLSRPDQPRGPPQVRGVLARASIDGRAAVGMWIGPAIAASAAGAARQLPVPRLSGGVP